MLYASGRSGNSLARVVTTFTSPLSIASRIGCRIRMVIVEALTRLLRTARARSAGPPMATKSIESGSMPLLSANSLAVTCDVSPGLAMAYCLPARSLKLSMPLTATTESVPFDRRRDDFDGRAAGACQERGVAAGHDDVGVAAEKRADRRHCAGIRHDLDVEAFVLEEAVLERKVRADGSDRRRRGGQAVAHLGQRRGSRRGRLGHRGRRGGRRSGRGRRCAAGSRGRRGRRGGGRRRCGRWPPPAGPRVVGAAGAAGGAAGAHAAVANSATLASPTSARLT